MAIPPPSATVTGAPSSPTRLQNSLHLPSLPPRKVALGFDSGSPGLTRKPFLYESMNESPSRAAGKEQMRASGPAAPLRPLTLWLPLCPLFPGVQPSPRPAGELGPSPQHRDPARDASSSRCGSPRSPAMCASCLFPQPRPWGDPAPGDRPQTRWVPGGGSATGEASQPLSPPRTHRVLGHWAGSPSSGASDI